MASTPALAPGTTFPQKIFLSTSECQQQEPVKNDQMLLLPFDFSGWKHILSNLVQWHHLRILAVWWREMSREISKASLGITSSNFHFLHEAEPAL